MSEYISISGARVHNLKNISLEIPKGKLTVITGVSGSGKSSLVYDLLYKEAQRRFLDSVSFYNKGFAPKYPPADAESIHGLAPVISISQKQGINNSRSTVGSITELGNRLRVVYSLLGEAVCPYCNEKIKILSSEQLSEKFSSLPENTQIELYAPVFRATKDDFNKVFAKLRSEQCRQLRINGQIFSLDDNSEIKWQENDQVAVLVAVMQTDKVKKDYNWEINRAFLLGNGLISVEMNDISASLATCAHNLVLAKLGPNFFSTEKEGACPSCNGKGEELAADFELTIKNREKPVLAGAYHDKVFVDRQLTAVLNHFSLSENITLKELTKEQQEILFYGYYDKEILLFVDHGYSFYFTYRGIKDYLERKYHYAVENGLGTKDYFSQFMLSDDCPDCLGSRISPQTALVKIDGFNIFEAGELSLIDLHRFLKRIQKRVNLHPVAVNLIKRMLAHLQTIEDIGLGYLNINRRSNSLSGGEIQRMRISGHIGAGISRVIYILDEPSIGLHAKDTDKLIRMLYKLRDQGNTVLVVEHDPEIILAADHIVELGPAAGVHGGELLISSDLTAALQNQAFLTGHYLNGYCSVKIKARKRNLAKQFITIRGATAHNLKNLTVKIPLNCLIAVTGVSGSGKSTLIHEILGKALQRHFYKARIKVGEHQTIEGIENIIDIRLIDQSPIGKTSRSNPATYTKIFDKLRKIMAAQPEALAMEFNEKYFSFNNKEGWCGECEGKGCLPDENSLLPEDERICPVCSGARYQQGVLQITYENKNIAEILNLTLEEAAQLFQDDRLITSRLKVLNELGLGYLTLGQSANTLSGGECQRLKLAAELGKLKKQEHALYILDEPTTGLHLEDIQKLLNALNRLVEAGNTVIVIEHQLEFISCADHLIDLGPAGGDEGGYLIAQGSVGEIIECKESATGRCLAGLLEPKYDSNKNA